MAMCRCLQLPASYRYQGGEDVVRVEPGHPSWDVGPMTNCSTLLHAIRKISWFVRVPYFLAEEV